MTTETNQLSMGENADDDNSMEQSTTADQSTAATDRALLEDIMCTFSHLTDRVTCNICGANLNRSSWGRHKETHSGQANYRCDICNKGFKRKFVLFNHRRLHTGEKPYSCGGCDKAFYTRSSLHNHAKSHGHNYSADK